MDGEARQRETGNVHFFDRASGILEEVEWGIRHQLEPGRTQRFEQRPKRFTLDCGHVLEIGEGKAGQGDPPGRRRHFTHSIERRLARRRRTHDPNLAGGRGNRELAAVYRHVHDPDERGLQAMKPAAHAVGHHAEADDVSRG